MPPTVTTAFAGRRGLSFNCPFATASRTAFSISRWAVTPNVLRNLRKLLLRASSSMVALSWLFMSHAPPARNACRTDRTDRRVMFRLLNRIENGRTVAKQLGQIQLIHNDFHGGRDRD